MMTSRPVPMRVISNLLIALCLLSLAGVATARKRPADLSRNQYAFSAAIRWGDFEGAWGMVDPAVRKARPMSDVELSRYGQIQVTSYRDLASMPGPEGTQMREIQIDLVNRNTMSQRQVRYTEIWRYDAEAKTWWVMALPDFWQGK